MSIIGNYIMLDKNIIQSLQNNTLRTDDVLFGETGQGSDYVNESEILNIDKSWHAIHQIFTDGKDNTGPSGYLVIDGINVNDEDVGYGPAILKTPEQVKAAYDLIASIDKKDFWAMYNINDLAANEIYPLTDHDIEDQESEKEFFEYIYSFFAQIKEFFYLAAEQNKYILFYLI